MIFKLLIPVLLTFGFVSIVQAKNSSTDSLNTVTAFKKLLSICKNADISEGNANGTNMFYEATPYVVYNGKNKKRAWKDFANYNQPEEKERVDKICYRINGSVNQDSSYKIIKYISDKQSEGVWHVLVVSYIKDGKKIEGAFAFLKIGERYGLGDID